MDLLKWFPILMRILNIIPLIQENLRTGGSVLETLKKFVPELLPILQEIGSNLFPIVDPDKATQAGIDVVFDVDGTKWVQNTLNAYNKNTALVVDGIYGKGTKAAVAEYQKAKGLKVDGWCGPVTSGSLAVETAAKVA